MGQDDGSPTDPNASDFKAGAHSVLDGKVGEATQEEIVQAITGASDNAVTRRKARSSAAEAGE